MQRLYALAGIMLGLAVLFAKVRLTAMPKARIGALVG